MDATTGRLVDYAMGLEFRSLPGEAVHECKRRLIDTFACAIAAYDEPLCRTARAVAKRYSTNAGASVWGCGWQTMPDAAAFANGVMLRFHDISDVYRVKSGGHPSDVISGIVAVGEAVHADGASVINALTLAYDIYCSFCETIDINSKGWDQPVYGVLACALGAGKLLRLSREQMANAVSLALAPNMSLFQTRCGELSSWKGCAGANASRNGVFAALLARDDFTGPTAVFEGESGLWDIVGRFDWQVSVAPDLPHRITRTNMKCFPVCNHGQSAVWAALEIRGRLRVEDISEIQVETYHEAVSMMGTDPSRWAPTTRETADHSLPYVVAIALLDGEVTPRSFRNERLADPAVASIVRKVRVSEDPALSAQHPELAPCRLTIRTLAGKEIATEVSYPKGHIKNPLSDAEVDAKFRGMFREYGDETHCEAVLRELWNFDAAVDIADTLKVLLRRSRRIPGEGK